MKIVYCLPATFNSGGIERVISSKVNWLVNHGYEVVIITTEQNNRPTFYYVDDRVVQIDLNINYRENAEGSFPTKILTYFRNKRKHRKLLEQFLSDHKADVVISTFANEMSCLPQIKDGSAKVLEFHFSKHALYPKSRFSLRWLWEIWHYFATVAQTKKFDKFILLTDQDKESWSGDNTMVVPNASSFAIGATAQLQTKKAIVVARLVYQKGLDKLLDVWENFHPRCPEWELEIIGDGPMKEELLKDVINRGLNDSITFTPAISNIQDKYLSASLLLMTSRYEGLPMVLIEAQTCGLPCISYDVPCGPASIIHDGFDGFLIEDGDAMAFADKIEILAKDDMLRQYMGRNAFNNSLHYTEETIMQQWVSIFEQVTKHDK